jgi:hypothetical protein
MAARLMRRIPVDVGRSRGYQNAAAVHGRSTSLNRWTSLTVNRQTSSTPSRAPGSFEIKTMTPDGAPAVVPWISRPGEQRQLTSFDLKSGSMVHDFDISPDGKRIVFDRLCNHADIALMTLAR